MIQDKNISPVQLALLASVILGVLSALLIYYFTGHLQHALIGLSVSGVAAFSLVYWLNERYIYRKIKLIYKFISQTKASRREEFFTKELLPRKTLDDVNNDVARWAEERKSEIERLQSNEAFRREFLANLAHELKTPIFSAQGYIETLLAGAMNDERVRSSFLENAAGSLDRLSDLVRDLDAISKLESNQLAIQKTHFVIQDLVRDVYHELGQKAAKKAIRLSIKRGCERDIEVYADKARIRQVLVNLVDNSINYGREHGETTTGVYIVDAYEVFIEVTDNGIGIQEEQIPRVFERFYRTDSARARHEGGTGLGLAIVKHIIEAHHHTVTCRSKADVGTSFGFSLDRKERN